ncbi:MAG: hypothetical protein HOY79_04790 [Streptomyces sp.]|nr:hypothetical protein [Streptomyces sp.]NUS15401.1 hypothetical protein [Streptomyces sp.]NUS24018.1 hypothetical protein [Streptomyces sp.]
MTGPEFAEDHGDCTTWTVADFEAEQNLAEIDAYLTNPQPTPAPAA